jgi:hypothetical protein
VSFAQECRIHPLGESPAASKKPVASVSQLSTFNSQLRFLGLWLPRVWHGATDTPNLTPVRDRSAKSLDASRVRPLHSARFSFPGTAAFSHMSKKDRINVAIVGLGFGAEFIPIYQRHPHANMYAICQRTPEKLNAVGDAFGIAARYTNSKELLKDPKSISCTSIRRSPITAGNRSPR